MGVNKDACWDTRNNSYPLIAPLKPFFAHFAHARDMPPSTPPIPLPNNSSPRIPPGPPFAALLVPKLPIYTFLEYVCAHMGPKWLRSLTRSLTRHAPQHPSRTPHLSPPSRIPRGTPLCCIVSPKIAHFKPWSLHWLIWVQDGSK